jgi:hypothetical protein
VSLRKIDFTWNRYRVKSILWEYFGVRDTYSIFRIFEFMILDRVESNIRTHFLFPKSQLPPKTLIITNHHAILCLFPILPIAMPTTAHIRYYMISDHVESNIRISLWHQEPHQPQCQPLFISDFTTAMPTTAHIWYYMILDHVESNICFSLWHQEPHQPPCHPLPISDFTNCNANHCTYLMSTLD